MSVEFYRGEFGSLSPELREQRLRTRVDELRHLLTKQREANASLRRRVERKDIRIAAMRRDQAVMQEQIRRLEAQLVRAAANREVPS